MKTIPLAEQMAASNAMYERALASLPGFVPGVSIGVKGDFISMRQMSRSLDARARDGRFSMPWRLVDPYPLAHMSMFPKGVPIVPDLDKRMLESVDGLRLDMGRWHCGSTHCRAGWAVVLAGEEGLALEVSLGTETAARLIYEASTGRIAPDFFATQEDAIADIRRCAELT